MHTYCIKKCDTYMYVTVLIHSIHKHFYTVEYYEEQTLVSMPTHTHTHVHLAFDIQYLHSTHSFFLSLSAGNKTMADVKRLYFKLREEVFSQRDMARRSQALDGFLQAHLGTQMKMSDIQHPRSVSESGWTSKLL